MKYNPTWSTKGARSFVVAALIGAFGQGPAQAQDLETFSLQFEIFTRACTQTAPDFQGIETAARPYGVSSFVFRPSEEGSTTIGRYYGGNYDLRRGGQTIISSPREPGEFLISYTLTERQLDRYCAVTFPAYFAGSGMRDTFYASVAAQFPDQVPRVEREWQSYDVGGLDFDFSTQSGGGITLQLHIWD